MATFSIVEDLDVLEQIGSCLRRSRSGASKMLLHERGIDVSHDGVIQIDQVKKGLSPLAPVSRAAGSAGEIALGFTGVAAPKAASSSVSRYSSVARLAASAADQPAKPTLV